MRTTDHTASISCFFQNPLDFYYLDPNIFRNTKTDIKPLYIHKQFFDEEILVIQETTVSMKKGRGTRMLEDQKVVKARYCLVCFSQTTGRKTDCLGEASSNILQGKVQGVTCLKYGNMNIYKIAKVLK
jgi:hypothetical protein